MAPSFTLTKVRGIRIGAHWSWLLVFALWSWSLARDLFPSSYPGLPGRTYVAMGLVSAATFFASILLHELGHAFRALREGMKIKDITLWLFGGVARFEGMFPSAGAEFRIAIAGPVVSVVLGIAFLGLAAVMTALSLPLAPRGVADYLGRINLILVAFNMVPALPLDGGRVLRAWLWHRQGDFTTATLSASRAGKAFAYLLIAAGIAGFFTATVTGGIWFVILGWFLLLAAQAEQNYALVTKVFRRVSVRDLMTRDPVAVPPNSSVSDFLADVQLRGHSTYPVAENGYLRGLVSLRLAASIPPEKRANTKIADIMLPASETPVVSPGTPMIEALDRLRVGPGRAVVTEGDRILGIVSASDVAKAVELERVRGYEAEPPKGRSTGVVWAVVVLSFTIAAAVIYRPPLVVISPGPAIDLSDDITIEGVPTEKPSGRILLVAVHVTEPNALQAALSMLNPDLHLITRTQLVGGRGVSEEEFGRAQREMFDESRVAAAAAAASAAGMEVKVTGRGALIQEVVRNAPARGKLRQGDVVTAIDGSPVQVAADLRKVTTARPPGTTFDLRVERGGRTSSVEVSSARLPALDQPLTGIGVIATTRDLDVQLPFRVEFRQREIGGPSAGLAYALTIADMIDPRDLAKGRTIAASGTIQLDGEVGPVGGLEQKAKAADEADAELFIVPREELSDVRGEDVHGVANLLEALNVVNAA